MTSLLLMTVAEYAAHRGCSDSYVRRLRRIGRLVVVGDLINVLASDVLLAQPKPVLAMQPSPAPATPAPGCMTTSQYAALRGVSTSYVRRLRRQGQLALAGALIDVGASQSGETNQPLPIIRTDAPGGIG